MDPDIGADLALDYNETVMITLTVTDPSAIADITWGGVAPPCPGCTEISFPAEVSGNVIVTVLDINGCIAKDTLILKVDITRAVFIPNVFSPNNDNINDLFTIQGKLLERIEYLRIFDRWGSLVYEQPSSLAGDLPGWDGTFNGNVLDPGVFVYTAKLIHADGTEEVVIGDITLLR
jgi:gliding motility-associated-like protein